MKERAQQVIGVAVPVACVLALVAIVLLVVTGSGGEPSRARVREAAPVDAAPDVPMLVAEARYHSFEEIVAAGDAAKHQLAVVPIRRGAVRDADFTAFPCPTEHFDNRYFLTIPPRFDDQVRAIPHHKLANAPCARALVRVLDAGSAGFTSYQDDAGVHTAIDPDTIVEASTIAILDVTPAAAAPAPTGVGVVNLVDLALLRRGKQGGVVVELGLRVESDGSETIDGVMTHTCDTRELVYFPDERKGDDLGKLSGCRTVRFRTRPDDGFHLSDDPGIDADLISIGAPAPSNPN